MPDVISCGPDGPTELSWTDMADADINSWAAMGVPEAIAEWMRRDRRRHPDDEDT